MTLQWTNAVAFTGSPSQTDSGCVYNFSESNYVDIYIPSTATEVVWVVPFTSQGSVTGRNPVLGHGEFDWFFPYKDSGSSVLKVYNGNTYNLFTPTANVKYWLRITRNYTAKTVKYEYSTDGVTYTYITTINWNETPSSWSGYIRLGNAVYSGELNRWWNGSIFLSEVKVTADGVDLPLYDNIQNKEFVDDITITGQPVITQSGCVSGFKPDTHIELAMPEITGTNPSSTLTYIIPIVRTSQCPTNREAQMGWKSERWVLPKFINNSNNSLYAYNNTTGQNVRVSPELTLYQKYWIKIDWTEGTGTRTYSHSTDGETFTQYTTFNDTSMASATPSGVTFLGMGNANSSETAQWFPGDIYLADTKIIADGVDIPTTKAQATRNIFIGSGQASKIYLGNTEVNKLYLGDTLVYGEEPVEDWTISDGGATLSRNTFPFTVPAYSGSTTITAATQFDMSLSLSDDQYSFVVDGNTVTGYGGVARDCTIGIMGTVDDRIGIENRQSDFADTVGYFQLNKDGTCNRIRADWADTQDRIYPANPLSYDSTNDTFTVKAGTYDLSTRSNTPVTLASDVVLNSMGGMYADSNWEIMFSPPSSATASISYDTMIPGYNNRLLFDRITVYKSSSSGTYYLTAGTIGSNTVCTISTTETDITQYVADKDTYTYIEKTGQQGKGTSHAWASNNSIITRFYLKSDAADIVNNNYPTIDIRSNYLMNMGTLYSNQRISRHSKTTNTLITICEPTSSSMYVTGSITIAELLDSDYIQIETIGRTTSSHTYNDPLYMSSMSGEYTGNISYPLGATTDYGQVQLDSGYNPVSGFGYLNMLSNGTIEDITSTPKYFVGEQS